MGGVRPERLVILLEAQPGQQSGRAGD
jgi:hypothetical protein